MDRADLLKPRVNTVSGLPEDEVDIPGIGTVRVRGLSRIEALAIRRIEDMAGSERKMVSTAMLDPTMNEEEVHTWQRVSAAGEMEPVTSKIAELSGMLSNSAKEAVKEFEADSELEFRVLPSSETEHDGSGSPSEVVG